MFVIFVTCSTSQMTRYNVPVIELAYYLFLSVDMDVRQTYLHDFLELYLDTFKDVASKLGYPVQMTHEVGGRKIDTLRMFDVA